MLGTAIESVAAALQHTWLLSSHLHLLATFTLSITVSRLRGYDVCLFVCLFSLLHIEVQVVCHITCTSTGQQCKYEESPYMTLRKCHRQNRSRLSANLRRAKEAGQQRQPQVAHRPHSNIQDHRLSGNYDSIAEENEELNVQLFEKAHNFKVCERIVLLVM